MCMLCQVLAALDEKVYDIILMDIHMPEMDGLEASQIIQQRFAPADRPRIVALSADTLQARGVVMQPCNSGSCMPPAASVAVWRLRGLSGLYIAAGPFAMVPLKESRPSQPTTTSLHVH